MCKRKRYSHAAKDVPNIMNTLPFSAPFLSEIIVPQPDAAAPVMSGIADTAVDADAQSPFWALSTEIYAVIGLEGALHSVNAAWHRTLGSVDMSSGAVMLMDFVHPEDCDLMRSRLVMLASMAQAETHDPVSAADGMGSVPGEPCEVRLRHEDGSYRWLQWNLNGSERRIYAAGRDITEQREQEQAISAAHQKLTFYLVNSPLAVVEWDCSGEIMYWSPQAETLFGWTADEFSMQNTLCRQFVHEDDQAAFSAVLANLAAEGETRDHVQSRHYRRDGAMLTCEWFHAALRDEDGNILSITSLVLDITERKRREEDLLKIRKAVESAGDAICIMDLDAHVIYLNRAFNDLFGYAPEELNHVGLDTLFPDAYAAREVQSAIEAGRSWNGELELRSRSKGSIPVFMRADAIRDDQGIPIGVVAVYTDLRERRQAQEELVRQARHDSLTGLPNRSFFQQRLARAFARGAEEYNRTAVMFFDLDNFKVINDSLGHEAGDHLLQVVAERLRACVRPEDMVARLGGDEFTVLLEGLNGDRDAVSVAERVSEQLRAPILLEGREIFATASIGIALSRDTHQNAEDLLRDADVAMYQAKTGGKAGYIFFNPQMNAEAMERLELEMDLRHAIDRGELQVYFQPIIHLQSGRVTEVEALLRWNHPIRGLISPVKFIPIAEETGLILPLGQWVLEQSCRQARLWQNQYPSDPPLVMSVNLSTRQIQQDDLIQSVEAVLHSSGIAANSLKLEITESVMMLDSANVIAKLHALKALGIRLAVDDFGTGYSSMSYLSSLPIDTLKIDRAFISRLGLKNEDDAIVRAILTMAKMMQMHVTAEGIETPEQLGELNLLGCERGQGYLFAKPLTGGDMEVLLQNGYKKDKGLKELLSLTDAAQAVQKIQKPSAA